MIVENDQISLFAFFDGMYTKINRVELSNEGEQGPLRYLSTSWYKEGNQLEGLASQQIDDHHGFISTQTDGAYRLSDLVFERRQRIKLDAVEAETVFETLEIAFDRFEVE